MTNRMAQYVCAVRAVRAEMMMGIWQIEMDGMGILARSSRVPGLF